MPHVNALPTRGEIEAEYRKVAFIGGIYSNYLALEAALRMLAPLRVDAVYALGDFGAFGPYPDRTLELLQKHGIPCIQGNYEEALSSGAEDCHCGYTDPRDNHFARLSYDYTAAHTAPEHKRWMAGLPLARRIRIGASEVLLTHGSPRRINEFLWQTTTPLPFIRKLLHDFECDLVACTHTGLPWHRLLDGHRGLVNVGALGRPANDGQTEVKLTVVEQDRHGLRIEVVPVAYDYETLAREMKNEGLPPEFIATISTGWWTSCLEVLPAKERAAGKF